MRTYVLRRILLMIPTFIGITLVTFVITQLVPGGPIEQMLLQGSGMSQQGGKFNSNSMSNAGQQLTDDEIQTMKELYGFDQPLMVRYGTWLKNILKLDLGDSYRYFTPVTDIIWEKIPVSFYFGLMTTLLTYFICIPLGILKAIKHQTPIDNLTSAMIFAGYSIPGFAIGLLLLNFFSFRLGWFPLGEFVSIDFESKTFLEKGFDLFHHTLLPLISYMVGSLAFMTILMKNSIIENMTSDFMKTALAKGVSYRTAVFKHALRNSLIPLATSFGNNISLFLTGSFLIEKVFNIDGIGLLGYQSIVQRDFPVVLGILVISSFLMLVGNLLSDLCVAWVDPRVRFR